MLKAGKAGASRRLDDRGQVGARSGDNPVANNRNAGEFRAAQRQDNTLHRILGNNDMPAGTQHPDRLSVARGSGNNLSQLLPGPGQRQVIGFPAESQRQVGCQIPVFEHQSRE